MVFNMVFNHESLQPEQGGMPWGKEMVTDSSPCAAGADQQMEVAGVCRSHFDPLQKPFESLFIAFAVEIG